MIIFQHANKLRLGPSRAAVVARDLVTMPVQHTRRIATAAEQPRPPETISPDTLRTCRPLQKLKTTRHGVDAFSDSRASRMDEQFIGQTGGQVFYKMMEKHGVKHIFGLPTVPVLQALRETPNPGVDVIPPKHEQGAGHMAEGYARASGKPGVVFVNSGHGITNMITPIQDALSDGTPMVVFFERDWAMGVDDPDAIGIAQACTKWAVLVKTIEELPRRINEAFEIATSGRPGPVLVDLHNCSRSIVKKAIPTRSSLPVISGAASRVAHQLTQNHLDATLQRVAQMINRAERPVIYAGQGVILSEGGPELLRDLAKICSIPVTTTLQGLGAFDELDKKALHMLGMHGTAYANMAMQEADLIVALGARFDDRVTMNIAKFAPKAYAAEKKRRQGGIVHFEIVPKNINKVIQATEAVEGDAATNLARLLPQLEPRTMQSRAEWFGMIDAWKKKWPLSDYERTPGRIMPQALIEQLSTIVGGREEKTYITTGVGQHQMWTAQYFRWRHPRTMITSGGLGTMGYGLPAAIGAKLARPEALVIDIDGDASLSMTISELLTAARFNIGIKVILLNNEEQGMVTQLQNIYYEDRYAHTHHSNPDFIKLAESMRVQCQSVSDPRDVSKSLEWLVNTEGPALLEVKTEKKVPVLPTVPAGGGLHEFIAYDEARVRKRRELIRERTCGVHG